MIRACILSITALAAITAHAAAHAQDQPPGFSTTLKGGPHDFDYLAGAWTTQQKRLKTLAVGSREWSESPANQHCAKAFMGGQALVEQSQFPHRSPAGLFLYTYSQVKQQWAIYWVNGKTGELETPSLGGFKGDRGEFYGDDEYQGRPIRVRVVWTHPDRDHARWEQAFSFDNKTWEVNWISDFTRADPAVCSNILG